jgi:hypothetical protein
MKIYKFVNVHVQTCKKHTANIYVFIVVKNAPAQSNQGQDLNAHT